jgi:glycosyltransferase involved in cell wall biosynthesis
MASSVHSTCPLVSVLVQTYNAANYLPQLCRSIQSQTYRHFEALILDDGSTDATRSVLAPFESDPRFRVFGWDKNRGVAAGLRELLRQGRGAYWTLPGADDVLFPDFLEQRLAWMNERPQAAFIHGPSEIIDEMGQAISNPFAQLQCPAKLEAGRALRLVLQHNIVRTPSIMIRYDLTRQILPYYLCDWKYAQDWHLWILLMAAGSDVLWDERPLVQYRVHSASLSSDNRLGALREAELRLVPLCALRSAAQYSRSAAEEWARWGTTLYRLWLMRSLKLRFRGALRKEWLELARQAYYGSLPHHYGQIREVWRHGVGMVLATLKQRQAIKGQSFRVSGLAEMDDPLFRAAPSLTVAA